MNWMIVFNVKVTKEEILVLDALLLVSINKVYTMTHTFQSFFAWPRNLIGYISEPSNKIPNPLYTFQFLNLHVIYVY